MIRELHLTDTGPARELRFGFAPRLNVLTGDNGLGKSFVLDVAWWALTATWAGEKAFPWQPPPGAEGGAAASPAIAARLSGRGTGEAAAHGTWRWDRQEWSREEAEGAPPIDPTGALVIYARVDNGYAVFDGGYAAGAPPTERAIILSPAEVWDGKEIADAGVQGGRRTVIGGLLADWVGWQRRPGAREFAALRRAVEALWPPDERVTLDVEPTRVHLRDRRDIPALGTAWGTVPVTLASAGMKRALSLAYLLVWAWTEHERAARLSRQQPTRGMVLLLDEPELHQHPAWQRAILPAILQAIQAIAPEVAVQVLATTHSPLVLASLEPIFDPGRDALFTLDLSARARRVRATRSAWRPRGDVSSWLTSEVFDLGYARSREAERALKRAVKALDDPELRPEEAREIHRALRAALGDTDPFWARWVHYARAKGIEP